MRGTPVMGPGRPTYAGRVTEELVFAHVGFGAQAVPYLDGWDLQRAVHQRRADGEIPDTCLMLEHEPVYTQGLAGKAEHVLPGGVPALEGWRLAALKGHASPKVRMAAVIALRRHPEEACVHDEHHEDDAEHAEQRVDERAHQLRKQLIWPAGT